MKTEQEVRDSIDRLMKKVEAMPWWEDGRESILSIIDGLLWVIGDESGFPMEHYLDEVAENGFIEVEEEPMPYSVVLRSEGGTKIHWNSFETEEEAVEECENHHWGWVDENDFFWRMEIEEN